MKTSYHIKPKYVNSPSWREAKAEILGWVGLITFFATLMILALLLTGGIY